MRVGLFNPLGSRDDSPMIKRDLPRRIHHADSDIRAMRGRVDPVIRVFIREFVRDKSAIVRGRLEGRWETKPIVKPSSCRPVLGRALFVGELRR